MNLITTFLKGQSAFQRLHVTPSAQAIYHALIRLANQNGWKSATVRTTVGAIRRLANLDGHAKVRANVNELIDAQLITIRKVNGSTLNATHRDTVVDITFVDDTASNKHKKQQQAAKVGTAPKDAAPTLGGDFS